MPAQPLFVVAKHSYKKPGEKILNFDRGDLMEVLEETNGKWWAARLLSDGNIAGYIPAAYVKEAHPDLLAGRPGVAARGHSRTASGSFKDRLRLFEHNSAPGFSPQPPRNDWGRATLPAKSSTTSPLSSPLKSATIARDNPQVTVTMGDVVEDERSRSPSPFTVGGSTTTTMNPMGALTKELRFEQKRGIQLGRPELQKVFDGGRSSGGHISPNPSKQRKAEAQAAESSTELGKMLQKQNQKLEAEEGKEKRLAEEEAAKPEFLKLKLKKTESNS